MHIQHAHNMHITRIHSYNFHTACIQNTYMHPTYKPHIHACLIYTPQHSLQPVQEALRLRPQCQTKEQWSKLIVNHLNISGARHFIQSEKQLPGMHYQMNR